MIQQMGHWRLASARIFRRNPSQSLYDLRGEGINKGDRNPSNTLDSRQFPESLGNEYNQDPATTKEITKCPCNYTNRHSSKSEVLTYFRVEPASMGQLFSTIDRFWKGTGNPIPRKSVSLGNISDHKDSITHSTPLRPAMRPRPSSLHLPSQEGPPPGFTQNTPSSQPDGLAKVDQNFMRNPWWGTANAGHSSSAIDTQQATSAWVNSHHRRTKD